MTITLYQSDIPADLSFGSAVAVDAEMMGLNPHRDRLCLIQLSSGDGNAHLVQFRKGDSYAAPNLKKLLTDPKVTKIFHYARLDLCFIEKYLGVAVASVYCTKIASRLCRTFSGHHGLKVVTRDLLDVYMDKHQQTTDWGAETLTQEQLAYAASDVYHLHQLRAVLDGMLTREGRMDLAQACFDFLPVRARLDMAGWMEEEIFDH